MIYTISRELAYHYTLTYARSLPQTSTEAEEASLEAIAMGLRLPSVFEFDNVSKIGEMNKLHQHPLYLLLDIFAEQDLQRYRSWESTNEKVLIQFSNTHHLLLVIALLMKQLDISKAQLDKKLRLLILTSLGYQYIGRNLSYSKIASVLHIDQSQVERWLIDGMSTVMSFYVLFI